MDSYLVTKSNDLIEKRTMQQMASLTVYEQRIVAVMISKISPDDDDFKAIQLEVEELAALTTITRKELHARLPTICDNLLGTRLHVENDPERDDGFLKVNWFHLAHYSKSQGIVQFELSRHLRPFLLRLKARFTSYHLAQLTRLKSAHSILLYEVMRSKLSIAATARKEFTLTIAEFRKVMSCEQKYSTTNKLKLHVIDPAFSEITDKTDIKCSYKLVRRGRSYAKIKITLSNKVTVEAKQAQKEAIEAQRKAEKEAYDNAVKKIKNQSLLLDLKLLSQADRRWLVSIIDTFDEEIISASLTRYKLKSFEDPTSIKRPKAYLQKICENTKQELIDNPHRSTKERLLDTSWMDDLDI